ncbi:MAG TPA: hypothetical protein VHH55_04060 [Gaiellaceae bacterium]|jgi:hypothetical protein|nr:hypothetical protein [Gaiellaceae bacterium]
MTAAVSRLIAPRREILVAGSLAFLGAALLVALTPTTGDAPAHLYRTLLVEEGVYVWDNLWYGGHYPLASYSLLYYLPAALVGNLPLVFTAVVVSAILFASIVEREWGAAGHWPARAFAVLAAGPIFVGTYSYALGLAAGLGALWALQGGRRWVAAGAAALTLGFSPLAFVFLCIVLVALALARRLGTHTLAFVLALAAIAAIQAAALVFFPSSGPYPFRALELAAVLTVSVLGAELARRSRRGAILGAFFLVWGAASIAMFLVSTPVGENLTRLRSVVFPVMLMTAFVARFRPRWLTALALSAALVYNVAPYAGAALDRTDVRAAQREFWAPAVSFLAERSTPSYRVEVVPTFDHWEAYWLPRAGIPLARGWYRQIDIARNELFYEQPLRAASYRDWLRSMGVRFVVLPETKLGQKGEEREAVLLRSGASGLRAVLRTPQLAIFEVPRPEPILTGPGSPVVTRLDHGGVAGRLTAAGTYRLKIRHTRYWRVRAGAICVERAANGMTTLRAARPGRFALAVPEGPGGLVRALVGQAPARC